MKNLVFKAFIIIAGVALLASPNFTWAGMSSTNYIIRMDSVGVGGQDTASSTSYKLRGAMEAVQGTSSSTSYRLDAGYRGGIYDPVAKFTVLAQDRNSQVAATAITSTTVTVASTSGYASGDYIVAVQNEGLSQASAVGRITAVGVGVLTVDSFSYATVLPTIDGSNDYVYELTTGSSIPLTGLTPSTPITGIVAWEVDSDVPSGYSVYVTEDQNLQNSGAEPISDVSDGTVTSGEKEYGARSSDTTLASSTFDTADSAIDSSLQQIASRSATTFEARDFLTLKAAVSTVTLNGAYSQTLTFVYVGNY